MRVYICGPMTGYPDQNFPAFHAAAKRIREKGIEVVSPAELEQDRTLTLKQYMIVDLPELCKCDGVVLLPGWTESKGANIEVGVARALGMPFFHETNGVLQEVKWRL